VKPQQPLQRDDAPQQQLQLLQPQQQYLQTQGQQVQLQMQPQGPQPGLDRSFEDPAHDIIKEDSSTSSSSASEDESESPDKKKGFMASLFKKQSPQPQQPLKKAGKAKRSRRNLDDEGEQRVPEPELPPTTRDRFYETGLAEIYEKKTNLVKFWFVVIPLFGFKML
jgi:hypothetical protein